MNSSSHVYLGIKAYVVCINISSGEEVWRTKVKRSQIVAVLVEPEHVIAHAGGELFGLDKASGKILWKNGLTGLGYGHCILATENTKSSDSIQSVVACQNSGGSGDGGGDVGGGD